MYEAVLRELLRKRKYLLAARIDSAPEDAIFLDGSQNIRPFILLGDSTSV
jgi:hypothetical protein